MRFAMLCGPPAITNRAKIRPSISRATPRWQDWYLRQRRVEAAPSSTVSAHRYHVCFTSSVSFLITARDLQWKPAFPDTNTAQRITCQIHLSTIIFNLLMSFSCDAVAQSSVWLAVRQCVEPLTLNLGNGHGEHFGDIGALCVEPPAS